MAHAISVPAAVDEADRDIAEAERLIAEKIALLLVALRAGDDTIELEARIREMRRGLELFYANRPEPVQSVPPVQCLPVH
jgi:hypothetical protein